MFNECKQSVRKGTQLLSSPSPAQKTHSCKRLKQKTKSSYLLQSLAWASWVKRTPVVGMEWAPQGSGLLRTVVLLLLCWTTSAAAAAGLSWTGCQLVLLWHCWSLLQPQESRCLPAHSVPGHGARCPSGCHPYSIPGWSHYGRHSLKN